MALDLKIPVSKLPAKKTLDIIQKASGKPMYKVKNFYKSFDTRESRKIKSNIKHNNLSKKEVKQLIRESQKEGLYMNETKLRKEFEKIEEEEKIRKIQYSKGRAKLAARMERIKSGEEEAYFRKFEGSKHGGNSKEERKKQRAMRIQGVISDLGKNEKKLDNSPKSSLGHPENQNQGWGVNKKNKSDTKEPLDLQID